eukprot:jgi/Botrbrau1/222/Bobra.0022s0201.1
MWREVPALMGLNRPRLFALLFCFHLHRQGVQGIFRDPSKSVEERVEDLLKQLTLAEKVDQLHADIQSRGGVPRLNVPPFEGWGECLHGAVDFVENSTGHTEFPEPMGLAAAFDTDLLHRVGDAIGTEVRAKFNYYNATLKSWRMLSCYAPNINIARDPRWGRVSETYGEDPFLTGQMAAAFVTGLQGNDSRVLKLAATCKHYLGYSMELAEGFSRHTFNAEISERDLQLTYTPAFRDCVQKGGAAEVMCSYNAVNGAPMCANKKLLGSLLRDSWNFTGLVVSDCGAVDDIAWGHHFNDTPAQGNAAALLAGTDMSCVIYRDLVPAIQQGLVTEADVDVSVRRVLTMKFRLGLFDPAERQPYSDIPLSSISSQDHLKLAVEAATKSMVLLKNEYAGKGPLLPLDISQIKKVAIIGPHANSSEHLMGHYYHLAYGAPASVVTPLRAFQNLLGEDRVLYAQGSEIASMGDEYQVLNAANQCSQADVCILFLGLSAINDHRNRRPEDTFTTWAPISESEGWDRDHLKLPHPQMDMVKLVVQQTRTPLVVVLIHGGPVDVQWLHQSDHVAAILTAWYPGQGAQAIADVIFGKSAPSGRLPITFYYNNYTEQMPMLEMDMTAGPGRTYRYLKVPVLYPFGHGLSYTTFTYSDLTVAREGPLSYSVSLNVSNTGRLPSDHVVLLYLQSISTKEDPHVAPSSLRGFQRVFAFPGGRQQASFKLGKADFEGVIFPWTETLDPTDLVEVVVGSLRSRLS